MFIARQLFSFETAKGRSLRLKRVTYSRCVRNCMLHSSESWLVTREKQLALSAAEMRMITPMCGVKLSDKVACVELNKKSK